VLSREAQSGLLTQVAGGGMRECGPIVMSPDGAHLYRGCGIDQIELFERDRSSGAIALADVLIFDAGGADSDSLIVSPDGNSVYAAGSGILVAFARAAATGRLSIIGTHQVGTAAFPENRQALAISPDGRSLYVTSAPDASVTALSIDQSTGNLTPLGVFSAVGGLPLRGVNAVAVGGDGRYVYAASFASATVSVFLRRDGGTISFVEAHPLEGAHLVASSGPGAPRNVYAVGSSALAVYLVQW
jgi:6-phosphogluconolactonase (cycloisomerase 2 family)